MYKAPLAFLFLFCLSPAPGLAQTNNLVVVSNIDLGTCEAPVGGTGTNQIGTNGNINYAASYSGPSTGVYGQMTATSSSFFNRTLRVTCETSKTMRNVGGTGGQQDRNATPIYISFTQGNPGTGTACSGLGVGGISTTINRFTPRTIYIGMDMDVADVRMGGQYALSNAPAGNLIVRARQTGGFGAPVQIDTGIDALGVFQPLITITGTTDIDFGNVFLSAVPGAGDHADIGTNGTLSFSGNFSGSGSGTAGAVSFTGPPDGDSVDVFCDSTATLTNGSGSSIDLTLIEVSEEGSTGNFGTGGGCSGVAGSAAATFTFQTTTRDEIFVGGRLDGATVSGTLSGTFSTSNAGGDNVEVVLVTP